MCVCELQSQKNNDKFSRNSCKDFFSEKTNNRETKIIIIEQLFARRSIDRNIDILDQCFTTYLVS